MESRGPGRPRDDQIDRAVLEVARSQLARKGYAGMTMSSVAAEAGTTRSALYRRFAGLADLATAAIAELPDVAGAPATGDAFADLVEELRSFARGISRPDGVSMVGTMLVSGTDPELVRLFRERLVAPRRSRIRSILERGVAEGRLAADADVASATNMATGAWYASALAGDPPPPDWPERTARLLWRSLGGEPPSSPSAGR